MMSCGNIQVGRAEVVGPPGLDGCDTVPTAVTPSNRAHPVSKPLRRAGIASDLGNVDPQNLAAPLL